MNACVPMSGARERVLALVSGLPSSKRYSRHLCMLQAYFDDSTQGGEVLVFAGWVAPTDTWLSFTDEWQALLDGPPVQRAFKMGRRRGGAAIARAKRHYALIAKYELVGVGIAVPIKALIKVVDELGMESDNKNPYFMAWRAVFAQCFIVMETAKSPSPIEFIFDNQTEKAKVIGSWDYFMGTCPARIRKYVRSTPTFRDDEEVLPLQAADLLAWWARKQYLHDKNNMKNMFPEDWRADYGDPNMLFAHLPEDALRQQLIKDRNNTPIASARATFSRRIW